MGGKHGPDGLRVAEVTPDERCGIDVEKTIPKSATWSDGVPEFARSADSPSTRRFAPPSGTQELASAKGRRQHRVPLREYVHDGALDGTRKQSPVASAFDSSAEQADVPRGAAGRVHLFGCPQRDGRAQTVCEEVDFGKRLAQSGRLNSKRLAMRSRRVRDALPEG
jgi:hypothetical protein